MRISSVRSFTEHSGLRCDLCSAEVKDIYAATDLGWIWFTQYRSETFHACIRCQQRRGAAIEREFAAAQERLGEERKT